MWQRPVNITQYHRMFRLYYTEEIVFQMSYGSYNWFIANLKGYYPLWNYLSDPVKRGLRDLKWEIDLMALKEEISLLYMGLKIDNGGWPQEQRIVFC